MAFKLSYAMLLGYCLKMCCNSVMQIEGIVISCLACPQMHRSDHGYSVLSSSGQKERSCGYV